MPFWTFSIRSFDYDLKADIGNNDLVTFKIRK